MNTRLKLDLANTKDRRCSFKYGKFCVYNNNPKFLVNSRAPQSPLKLRSSFLTTLKPSPPSGFYFDSHSCCIPHPSKERLSIRLDTDLSIRSSAVSKAIAKNVNGAGEDSYFALDNALSVADGVGGWSLVQNGNSALYSRLLSYHLIEHLVRNPCQDMSIDSVANTIFECHKRTNLEKILGSTTLCLCLLKNKELMCVNIGDSGFMLIRDGNIIMRSNEQLLSFNTPNQMGPNLTDTLAYDFYKTKVCEGDYVVVYTDGVSDNLFNEEISEIVRTGTDPKKIAETISRKAKKYSFSNRLSPFEISARNSNFNFRGGKTDDISVVVGRVSIRTDRPKAVMKRFKTI